MTFKLYPLVLLKRILTMNCHPSRLALLILFAHFLLVLLTLFFKWTFHILSLSTSLSFWSQLKGKGTTLVGVVGDVAVVLEEVTVEMHTAMLQLHQLRILGTSHPWVASEVFLNPSDISLSFFCQFWVLGFGLKSRKKTLVIGFPELEGLLFWLLCLKM